MRLNNSSLTDFLNLTAGSDPVPGGGSISALCGALASALTKMVAGLTVGRKKYADVETEMTDVAQSMAQSMALFQNYIELDAEAYDKVYQAFKLPKETDEEKAARHDAIQKETLAAALVPLTTATAAVAIMDNIALVAEKGNRNCITDACVAMMCARTAALGAILNVRINLQGLDDKAKAAELAAKCDELQQQAVEKEQKLLSSVTL